jgi:hypothetical protein
MAHINPTARYADFLAKQRGRLLGRIRAPAPLLRACHWAGCTTGTRSAGGYCARHAARLGGAPWQH